jgi:formylglycine-generating enzyme required for sulfatase activity
MSRIFISYATKDGGAEAQQLVAALEAAGRHCWVAPRDVAAAIPYPDQIVDAISESRGLVVLLTPGANQSPDVLQEVTLAHNERKLIAALVIRGTEPSGGLRYFLVARHRISWTEAKAAAAAVGKVLAPEVSMQPGDEPAPAPSDNSRAASKRQGRRWLWGCSVIAVVAIAYAVYSLLPARAKPVPIAVRGAGERFQDCADVCPVMIVIPRGRFQMGSPSDEPGHLYDEGPVREVRIDYDFAVGLYPVTHGEWKKYLAKTGRSGSGNCSVYGAEQRPEYSWKNPGFAQDDSHPVVCVSWKEAQSYASWLSGQTGRHYRLLSEAEYEYINRAGSSTAYFWGSSAEHQCQFANGADAAAAEAHVPAPTIADCDDGYAFTSPAGTFKKNLFGLYDTTGNAWSWTQDCWHESYNGAAPTDGSPWVDVEDCSSRVIRGGSWGDTPAGLRAAIRIKASDSGINIGLRLACTD